MKLRPNPADKAFSKHNQAPTMLRFKHEDLVHLRPALYRAGVVETLCGLRVEGEGKRLRFKDTYDPPAGTPACEACAREQAIRTVNFEKRRRR